jgi:hypothetical protein
VRARGRVTLGQELLVRIVGGGGVVDADQLDAGGRVVDQRRELCVDQHPRRRVIEDRADLRRAQPRVDRDEHAPAAGPKCDSSSAGVFGDSTATRSRRPTSRARSAEASR